MNLAFLCLYDMKNVQLIGFIVIALCYYSCDDDTTIDNEVIGIEEPIDSDIRLQNIIIEDASANVIQDVLIEYDVDQLISTISFSGLQNRVYTMEYAVNNRVIGIQRSDNSGSSNSTLTYLNNTIIVRTMFPDGRVEERELGIDAQNRINNVILFEFLNTGTRTAIDEIEYVYTQNFNVSRINDLSANGNTIEASTDFTYLFNNNPFRDMNDVIRFLIFEDFVPYTRFLPSTKNVRERVNGPFAVTSSVTYEYVLQEDDFPSSRQIATTTAAGTDVTVERFIYN